MVISHHLNYCNALSVRLPVFKQKDLQMVQNVVVHLVLHQPKGHISLSRLLEGNSSYSCSRQKEFWVCRPSHYGQNHSSRLMFFPGTIAWYCNPYAQGSLSPNCSNFWFHNGGRTGVSLSTLKSLM